MLKDGCGTLISSVPVQSSRRAFLKGAIAASFVTMPCAWAGAAPERSLRVSTLGGYCADALSRFVYPEFENRTGVRIEPVANRTGIDQADLVMIGQIEAAKGRRSGLWRPFDKKRMPNVDLIDRRFLENGTQIDAIPGIAWYQTLVVNPDEIGSLPTSWKILWESHGRALWGLASGGDSALFEITAATWFGGNGILETPEGVQRVMTKIQELKPAVKLWWDSESVMENAYTSGDVTGGMYFHDVASLMARNGAAIASIFPSEGAVIDFASWCQPASSTKIEEAGLFVDFMCMPTTQATLTRKIGAPPLVDHHLTDLTDSEFSAAASDRAPIAIAVDARVRSLDLMNRQFLAMLTS